MAAPPPMIQHPNENEGPRILAATLTVTSVALLTTIARLAVRIRMIRNVGWDDYFMAFTMALCLAGQGVIIPQVHYGAGKHIDHIAPEDFPKAMKLNFVTQPMYLWGICLAKESIGFFLLRIASTAFYRRLIMGIMVFMGFYTLGCFFTIVLQCTNLNVMWDPTVKATCWSVRTLKTLSYTNVSLNILTDLLFAVIIPVPMLWHVQMNKRQKASLIAILSMGIFATAAALIKVGYLPNYGKEGDWLWDSRNITIWTVIECNMGIIGGNMPCLKPLFRTVLGSTYGRGSRRTGSKPISGPYGVGSRARSTAKDAYNSLASSKTGGNDRPLSPYANYEAHVMTNFGKDSKPTGEKSRASSIISAREEGSTENRSVESIELLDERPKAFGQLGGILKTTEVSQEDTYNLKPERKTKHMV